MEGNLYITSGHLMVIKKLLLDVQHMREKVKPFLLPDRLIPEAKPKQEAGISHEKGKACPECRRRGRQLRKMELDVFALRSRRGFGGV